MPRRAMLILAGSLAGCAPRPPAPVSAPASVEQSASAPTDSAVLTLERTPCFGACPVYMVTVSAGGEVRFQGNSFVSHPGLSLSRIPQSRVDSLIAELDAAGYFEFDERYVPGSPACGNAATDLPTVTTSVTVRGRTRRIQHYRGCSAAPQTLSRLEDRIDEVLNTAQWIGHGR